RIVHVDSRTITIVVFEVPRRVVNRLRPGKGVEEIESLGIALLYLRLERVVTAESSGKRLLDGREVRYGTAGIHREILSQLVGYGLVGIRQNHQPDAMIPHVCQV